MNIDKIEYCKKVMEEKNKTYFFATKLLPKKMREAAYVLYTFYKIPDDIVDVPNVKTKKTPKELLGNWITSWQECYKNGKSYHPALEAAYQVHQEYNIDYKYSEGYLKAIQQDLTKNRYQTFEDLKNYMYGSASTIGITLTYIFGTADTKVLELSSQLAYGVQLTNLLRNIPDDLAIRSRIYIPQEDFIRFDITEDDFKNQKYPKRWTEFMEFQLRRAENFYNETNKLIDNMGKGRLAVKFFINLHMEYNNLIRESGYKIFENEYKVSTFKMYKILFKSLF
jgi:phytoene synthase